MSKLKITLKKSKIGRIEKHIRTCEALGLHKIGQSVIKEDNDAHIKIRQDANIYTTIIQKAGTDLDFEVKEGRQAYFSVVEGKVKIGEHTLDMRDGVKAIEETVTIHTLKNCSHILVVEMAKN